MKRIVLSAMLLTTASAIAQPSPKYAPIVLDEATYNTLMTYLGEQPYKFSAPLLTWLQQAEAKAATDATKTEPTKPADTPKP